MHRILRPAAAGLVALALLFGACSDKVTPQGSDAVRDEDPPAQSAATPTTPARQGTQPSSNPTTAPPSGQGSNPGGGSGATVSANDLSIPDLVKLAEPAVVRIATGGGVGSGFIVSSDGYIITNNHVVEGATTRGVRVTLSDGAEVTGRVVGTDPRSDLALVKIDGNGYRPLAVGNLDEVQVGQDVVAIGYALDLKRGEGPSFSVTRGIVSAKNRAIEESSQILGAIQTDAAINHGNSGGPLLNLRGEVVGVNTAIAPDPTTGDIAPGIGFAVGADTVKAVYEQLRANGRVNRGLLGIANFTALRPAKARELGIPETTGGVLLAEGTASVSVGGPASAAGLQPGDVIVRIGEAVIRNESDLAVAMIKNGPGTRVTVEFYRNGEKRSVDVTLGTPPAQ